MFSLHWYICICAFLEQLVYTVYVLGNKVHASTLCYINYKLKCMYTAVIIAWCTRLNVHAVHCTAQEGCSLTTANCKWNPHSKPRCLQPVKQSQEWQQYSLKGKQTTLETMLAFHAEIIAVTYCIAEVGRLKKWRRGRRKEKMDFRSIQVCRSQSYGINIYAIVCLHLIHLSDAN